MEVIKKFGYIEETCQHCHSILRVDFKDVEISDYDNKISYQCPVCKRTNKPENVPSVWMDELYPQIRLKLWMN